MVVLEGYVEYVMDVVGVEVFDDLLLLCLLFLCCCCDCFGLFKVFEWLIGMDLKLC